VTKVHQGTFTAGTAGAYLLTVGNLGPSDAAAPLTVTDTLPASETFESATGTGWTCSATGQLVTCTDSAHLPAGENAGAITLEVDIASSATGTISNTAVVTSETADPVISNNSATDVATLAFSADLSITKSHTGDFTAGLDGTYTIDFHDAGPSDSGTGVLIADTLPSGESFVGAAGTGWTCTAVRQSVTCTLATSVAITADAPPLTLTVAVGSGAVGTLTNVAQVEGPNPDPDLGNNTASDPTTSDRSFALSLTKSLDGPLQDRGDAGYALAVSNGGPSDSVSPVTVTDPLPAGLTFVSSTSGTGGAWSCAGGGGTVTCVDGTPIVAATTSTVDITVAVSAPVGSTITNTATVEAAGDVGAVEEVGSVEGVVTGAAPIPDSGAPRAGSPPLLAALLLVVAGVILAAGSRRRRWRRRTG
jgi:uncharacterized repeat protein (TIGR01451 family)